MRLATGVGDGAVRVDVAGPAHAEAAAHGGAGAAAVGDRGARRRWCVVLGARRARGGARWCWCRRCRRSSCWCRRCWSGRGAWCVVERRRGGRRDRWCSWWPLAATSSSPRSPGCTIGERGAGREEQAGRSEDQLVAGVQGIYLCRSGGWAGRVERVTGIEPAPPAWKAGALAVELHPPGGRP